MWVIYSHHYDIPLHHLPILHVELRCHTRHPFHAYGGTNQMILNGVQLLQPNVNHLLQAVPVENQVQHGGCATLLKQPQELDLLCV